MKNLKPLGNATLVFFMLCLTAYSTPSKTDNAVEFKEGIRLADRVTYGRALETAIWAMPLMNMEAMRQAHRDAGVQNNDHKRSW